jgi:5-methylcytosine-specific restriction endonuclease McrA
MAHYCLICKQLCQNAILLRTGEYVCAPCINSKESLINELQDNVEILRNRKPPINIWDIVWVINFICFGLFGFYLWSITDIFFLAIIIWFIAIWLSGIIKQISERANIPYNDKVQEQIKKYETEIALEQNHLRIIYQNFWDLPPDWEWRRRMVINRDKVCKECGRKMDNSKVPFHIHHAIPKSLPEGNHALTNLALLCEICHSKKPGHEMVKAARGKRLSLMRKNR